MRPSLICFYCKHIQFSTAEMDYKREPKNLALMQCLKEGAESVDNTWSECRDFYPNYDCEWLLGPMQRTSKEKK